MEFKNTSVWGFKAALRGMRNPLESWSRSDSYRGHKNRYIIGKNDTELSQRLIKNGSPHRKFMRQIFVSVDINAPLYWWKEFDTYKVGIVSNSTSTMHRLANTEITPECFEIDDNQSILEKETVQTFCDMLNEYRLAYLKTKDKRYWRALIQLLPESWLQLRTITMTYENIYNMIRHRERHKLNEWSGIDDPNKPNFIAWARMLPYAKKLLFYGMKSGKDVCKQQ